MRRAAFRHRRRRFAISQRRRVGLAPSWCIVDEFFTVQIRGRVTYTLYVADGDHLELRVGDGGKRTMLRRCSP